MADILLFGPQAAGKTQLYHSLQGLTTDFAETDQADYTVKKDGFLGWIGLRKYTIHEIGGKDMYLYDKDYLRQAFLSNSNLVFVFNGNEFINELKNYKQGGLISSLLRCYVIPALEKDADLDCQHNIVFIATHADEYDEEDRDKMKTEIYTCLEKANEEYLKVANGTRYYLFKKLFRGNLFCVNATDPAQVCEVFNSIIKS